PRNGDARSHIDQHPARVEDREGTGPRREQVPRLGQHAVVSEKTRGQREQEAQRDTAGIRMKRGRNPRRGRSEHAAEPHGDRRREQQRRAREKAQADERRPRHRQRQRADVPQRRIDDIRPPGETERTDDRKNSEERAANSHPAEHVRNGIRIHPRDADSNDDRRDQERGEHVQKQLGARPLPLGIQHLSEHQLSSPAAPTSGRAERSSSTKLSSRSRSITSRSSLSAVTKYSFIAGCHPRTTHSSSRPAETPRERSVKGRSPRSSGAFDTRSRLMPPRNAAIGISASSRPSSITPT